MTRYQQLLREYEERLDVESRALAATRLSHGDNSPQAKRQRARVATYERQVAELRKLAEGEK